MRNPVLKRQISAWLLLAVFLPMLALSSVHVHRHAEASATQCADCLAHSCSGHLVVLDDPLGQCVLCQFLSLPYVAAATIAVIIYPDQHYKLSIVSSAAVLLRTCGVPSLRAPPVSVLN